MDVASLKGIAIQKFPPIYITADTLLHCYDIIDVSINLEVVPGGVERAVRTLVGLGIISLAFVGPKTPWAYLGIVPVLTGLIGWCSPYAIVGFSTCKNCK
jgi:hypothetical protein